MVVPSIAVVVDVRLNGGLLAVEVAVLWVRRAGGLLRHKPVVEPRRWRLLRRAEGLAVERVIVAPGAAWCDVDRYVYTVARLAVGPVQRRPKGFFMERTSTVNSRSVPPVSKAQPNKSTSKVPASGHPTVAEGPTQQALTRTTSYS